MEKRCLRWSKPTLSIPDVQTAPILIVTWRSGKKMWVGIEDVLDCKI